MVDWQIQIIFTQRNRCVQILSICNDVCVNVTCMVVTVHATFEDLRESFTFFSFGLRYF